MPVPQALVDFNVVDATASLWLFRKSGQSDNPVFTGHWVQIANPLNDALKESIAEVRDQIAEANPYDILATIDSGQSLTIDTDETHADRIVTAAAADLPQRRVLNVGHMQNTDFYVVKLTHEDNVLYAVTKTDASWKSRRVRNQITVYFSGDQLGLETNPAFFLSRGVDFFIAGDDVVILDRNDFESVLNYKAAHSEEFEALQEEPTFIELFVDLAPLVAFVGTHKLHLRRACAIRAKGLYQDAQFMTRLRQNYAHAGLNLTFDAQGRIVASPEQCRDIIRAFLDHRLHSLFSENFYDVQSATVV
jgi:hypothetical protein